MNYTICFNNSDIEENLTLFNLLVENGVTAIKHFEKDSDAMGIKEFFISIILAQGKEVITKLIEAIKIWAKHRDISITIKDDSINREISIQSSNGHIPIDEIERLYSFFDKGD